MAAEAKAAVQLGHEKVTHLFIRLLRELEYVLVLGTGMFVGYAMVATGNVGFARWLETVTGDMGEAQRAQALLISFSLVGFLILRGVGTLVGTYSSRRLTAGLAHRMRIKMFHKLLKIPMEAIDAEGVGQQVMRITMMVNHASNSALNVMLTVVRDGMQAIWLVAYLLYLSWQLTLVMILILPVMAALFAFATKQVRNLTQQNLQMQGGLAQQVNETVQGIQVVKIFQGEPRESARFKESSNALLQRILRMTIVESSMIPAVQVLTGVMAAVITYMALTGVSSSLSGEQFVAYFVALGMMFTPLRQMTRLNIQVQMCLVSLRNIFLFLDEEEEQRDGLELPSRMKTGIVARNLSFTYPGGAQALKGLDFELTPGSVTALVGHSGSGKTTLTSLLCGFYRTWKGDLMLDGHDLRQAGTYEIRKNIAFVSQNVVLFTGTLADNISYGRPDASQQDIEEATRQADAWDFVSELQDGLDTQVGVKGVQLSGGQKQRISIARAFLRNAPILILDEATAALDNISERRIQAVMRKLMRGKITLIISHRLQFVKEANEILVLSAGKLVERGTHSELLEAGGYYTSLYEHRPADKKVVRQPAAQALEVSHLLPMQEVDMQTMELPLAQPQKRPLAKATSRFRLENSWYERNRMLWLAAPVSMLMYLMWTGRSVLYKLRLKRSWQLPAPVVVIGNLTVGGTGKTPFVAWMARHLMERGLKVGIISRGYGGKSRWYPLLVEPDTPVEQIGDEAWLLKQELDCPMAIGPDRLLAASELLLRHPCDLLLSDDGIQHLRLGRRAEIVMLDGKRRFGNGMLLPAGPLREPKGRLKKALYAVVKDGEWSDLPCQTFQMTLQPKSFVHLNSGQRTPIQKWLWSKRVHACAAIGNPSSFFDSLRSLGFEVIEHSFPDHYAFAVKDLGFPDSLPLVMTQKDASKCRDFHLPNAWYLEVQTEVSGGEAAVDQLLRQVGLSADSEVSEQLRFTGEG